MMSDKYFSETVKNMRNHSTRPQNEGEYWSNEDKQKLIEYFEDAVGITEMAVIFHRSELAVIQQIEKLDLYERKNFPQRIRSRSKSLEDSEPLCGNCKIDLSLCPHCELFKALQEGV